MSTIYLLIMAVLSGLCIFLARSKNKDDVNEFKELSKSDAERVIRVYDMDEAKLNDTIDEFLDLYSGKDDDVERPKVDKAGDVFVLTFTPAVDYISLCYWVNYLVYANDNKHHHYRVRGWYTFGEVQIKGEGQCFSNQTVMLYVDKNDTEGDNVSFVTPDGRHFLQPFAISGNLKAVGKGSEKYITV